LGKERDYSLSIIIAAQITYVIDGDEFAFPDRNDSHKGWGCENLSSGYEPLTVRLERGQLTAGGLSIEVCLLAASEGHRRRAVNPWHVTLG
jgi:hypothetical protein